MNDNRLITPEGTRDLLFEDCLARHRVEESLRAVFTARGFSEVITPALEFYDVFTPEGHAIPQEYMFKLTDRQGRLMAVKPDLTMPIARLSATRLRDQPLPLRLYYNQSAYRVSPADSGHSNEVEQAGIEIIGAPGAKADLEALFLAIQALRSCGLKNYRLEIGHIGIFNALAARLAFTPREKEAVRELIAAKNYPALSDRTAALSGGAAEALGRLPALFGGEEVLAELTALIDGSDIREPVEYLRSLLKDLAALGAEDCVSIDLGIVGRNEYYTGIVFQGYTEGVGDTVLTGGRYDTLLSDFGADLPAIGFGLDVDAAARVIRQGMDFDLAPDTLVYAESGFYAKGLSIANEEASAGRKAEFSVYETMEETLSYARRKGIRRLLIAGEEVREVIL